MLVKFLISLKFSVSCAGQKVMALDGNWDMGEMGEIGEMGEREFEGEL